MNSFIGAQGPAAAIVLDGAELRYDDASLAAHALAAAADFRKEAPEQTRQAALDAVALQKSIHSDAPRLAAALDEVAAFLREPKSIRVTAKPPHPVSLGEIMAIGEGQPEQLMEALGVTVDRP
jgi:hypothetical protein